MTTADELERLKRLEHLALRAKETGDADALAKVFGLLRMLIDATHPEPAEADVQPSRPDPMTRAHAREAHPAKNSSRSTFPGTRQTESADERQEQGLHKLRKGRDQCTATTRNGGQCQAPAIPGGLVCRRHGGSAPQVAIKAEYTANLAAAYGAQQDWEQARGTPREFDALIKALAADRDVEGYRVKMRLAKMMRDELRQRKRDT